MTAKHFKEAYHYHRMDKNYPLVCGNCKHSKGSTICSLMIEWNCQDASIDLNGKCFNHELEHNKPHEQLTLF